MSDNGKRNNYGSTDSNGTVTKANENGSGGSDDGSDVFCINDVVIPFSDDCCYMQQIREQSGVTNGPVMVNYQYARSRRRPVLVRTKSESDFHALLDEDVQQIRDRLVRRYGKSHGTFNLKSLPSLTRQQWVVLATLAIVEFTCFCTMSILAPFFPSEASAKGVPNSISGFVFSIYALVIFLTSPLMGVIVGQVGAKFLLILGVLMGGCCNILFGVLGYVQSTGVFIGYCFLVRIFEACGAAAFSTASYTIVAEVFPDNVGVILGVLETFVGLGLSCGPAVGGFLYDYGGYGLPFYTLGCLMLSTIPLSMFAFPRSVFDANQSQKHGGMMKLLRLPSIVVLCLVIVIVSNAWSLLDPTLEPHLREFNLSAKQLGLFFLLLSATYAISSPIWGWLADKIERTWIMMVVGLIISGLGLFLLGPSPFLPLSNTIPVNIVALFILGASIGMTLLPTFEALLDCAFDAGYPDEASTYGLIAGLWSGSYSLGEVIGPSMGGFLLDHFGFPICTTVNAAICILLGIFVLLFYCSARDPAYELDRGGPRSKTTTEVSDSGISDNAGLSSSQSSSSMNGNKYSSDSNEILIVHEKTPLLLPREFDQRTSNLIVSSVHAHNNVDASSPVDIYSDEDYIEESCIQTRESFPDVLKTVCFTGTGAVEV
ncbi:unnamed protein product [Orchesella dallaii]|uniref:Major facilitator superfamily (MFS) profile domain-containing protein n=1 Tax=Orchesella dallaii TaxID=48710 RepID=A0ABP1PTF5_9HEXA